MRIDADHFTPQVEERPARVPRIHRRIGLDEGNEILLRQVAPLRTDDAGRHRAFEAERLADRDDPFADLELLGIADRDLRQVLGFDLEKRHVRALVGADDLGLELALVGQLDRYLVRSVDDVRVRDEVTVARNDESRADRLLVELAVGRAASARHLSETAEELVERIVFRKLGPARSPHPLRDVDGHHRRALLVVELGEVGKAGRQAARLCLGGTGDRHGGKCREDDRGGEGKVAMHHGNSASWLSTEKSYDRQRRATECAICLIVATGASPNTVTRLSSCCRMTTLMPPCAGDAERMRRGADRLDEHRDGDEPVRIDEMRHAARVAQAAETVDDLDEAGRHPGDDPSRFLRWVARAGLTHLPARRDHRPGRAHHLAVDLRSDRDLGERELLDPFVLFVEDPRLDEEAGLRVDPELVTVAQPILRLEHPGLRVDARDAPALGLPEIVELGQRRLLLRRQRRERIAERARLDADELRRPDSSNGPRRSCGSLRAPGLRD